MPRLTALSVTIMSAFAAAGASIAYAADGNSYRPGQIYLKANAPAAGACALQCEGDAQCKSWNYIPQSRSGGVCEFNSNFASVQPHPYALSGVNDAGGYRSTNVIAGATRTTRIGQPVTVRANTQAPLQSARTIRGAAHAQPSAVKPPVITRQRSFARQTAPAQNPAHNIPAQARAPMAASPYATQRRVMPQQQRPAPYPAPPSAREIAAQRAALEATMRAKARTIPASARSPRPAAPATVPAAQRPTQAPAVPTAQGYPRPQAQSFEAAARASLYGGLYDDVATKPKAAPQPLYSQRPAENPDAPIATSPFAKPTIDVNVMPLAGAAPR